MALFQGLETSSAKLGPRKQKGMAIHYTGTYMFTKTSITRTTDPLARQKNHSQQAASQSVHYVERLVALSSSPGAPEGTPQLSVSLGSRSLGLRQTFPCDKCTKPSTAICYKTGARLGHGCGCTHLLTPSHDVTHRRLALGIPSWEPFPH